MSKQPRVLALVGMPGTGKTLCAKHLEKQGFFQFRFGSIVTNEVIRRGQEINPENERIVREELREKEGMAAIAQRALPHLQTALQAHPRIVIDGLYSFSEYVLLQEQFGQEMVVVAVVSPRVLRYQRLTTREDRPLTIDEAQRRDFQEIQTLEKGGPIAIADYTIINDGEPDDLLRKLDDLLEQLAFTP